MLEIQMDYVIVGCLRFRHKLFAIKGKLELQVKFEFAHVFLFLYQGHLFVHQLCSNLFG
jgi:hypothetical protein